MAPSKLVRNAKRCHFSLLFLYALCSMLIFLLPFIFINYASTFQFSAVATVHLVTGVLIAALVFYAALVLLVWSGKRWQADDAFTNEKAAQRFFDRTLLAMYSGLAVVLAVIITLVTAAVAIELYNLMVILFVECPQLTPWPHDHNHTNWSSYALATTTSTGPNWLTAQRADSLRQQYSNTLDVLVSYQDEANAQHVLLLRYNMTDKHIVQHSRHRAAKPDTAWVHEQRVQERVPLCTADVYSPYQVLEREIGDALQRRQTEFEAKKSVTVQGHDAVSQSSELEDRIFFNMMIRKICRNEYGFVIFLIVFLLLIALLGFITLGWFLYVRQQTTKK